MKKIRAGMVFLFAFIYVTFLLACSHPVQAASGTLSTDQVIYPIWGIGGTVTVAAQNLEANVTYHLWLQKPNQILSYLVGTPFTRVNVGIQAPISLPISPSDPPGTYILTLSRSGTTDTTEAVAHFGIYGSDSRTYERTKVVTIKGGGFAANSNITLHLNVGNIPVPNFPVNIVARANGEFAYSFKLSPSSPTGTLNATASGLTFDSHQNGEASSSFTVKPTIINVKTLKPPAQVERTAETSASYRLSYADGSPVTEVNATADIVSGKNNISTIPLVLVNSTLGEWRATWSPPPSANSTTYHFQLYPTTLTDSYGNTGQGPPVPSTDFKVVPASLQLTIQTNSKLERSQASITTISATYPNGANVANVTQANVVFISSDGKRSSLAASVNGSLVPTRFQIPLNASLGNWTMSYTVQDVWGNSGSGKTILQVQLASPSFQPQTPPTTERTTSLNVTSRIYYPDGASMNSTAKTTLTISHGNQTWTPKLDFNSTSRAWYGSLYIAQNATLGSYNITWSTYDAYGNGGHANSTTEVIPARFRFYLPSNNSTVDPLSNLDLNMSVRYPNGTTLPNIIGNVTGSYRNSTGTLFTLPLAYNGTEAAWHMYLSVPEEGNLAFSFSAVDRFGNAGVAMDAYNLRIIPSQRVQTQRLLIAGIIGVLVPVALLIYAVATISARRRKHRP